MFFLIKFSLSFSFIDDDKDVFDLIFLSKFLFLLCSTMIFLSWIFFSSSFFLRSNRRLILSAVCNSCSFKYNPLGFGTGIIYKVIIQYIDSYSIIHQFYVDKRRKEVERNLTQTEYILYSTHNNFT